MEILLAWVPSSDGNPAKIPHPCIYFGDSPKTPGKIIVAGITSELHEWVDGYSCHMPWREHKHPQTGLDRPSILQAHWRPHIPHESVCDVIGFVFENMVCVKPPGNLRNVIQTALALHVANVKAAAIRANLPR